MVAHQRAVGQGVANGNLFVAAESITNVIHNGWHVKRRVEVQR